MAADALLEFVSYRPSADADGIDPHREAALAGALLVNEAIGHLRAISKTDIRIVTMDTADGG